jgi:hypothetical protein
MQKVPTVSSINSSFSTVRNFDAPVFSDTASKHAVGKRFSYQ